jgi:DNA-binding MarR family transcriptional regulator
MESNEAATGSATCAALGELVGGERVTLVGLVLESAAGLRRHLAPSMEDQVGVGGQAFEILLRLGRSPGGLMRMSDLAAQTGLTPSGLTRAFDRLVEVGLCARQSCPEDRRVTFAALSNEGRVRLEEAVERHLGEIDELLGGVLTATEEDQLVELLRRLRDRLHPEAALLSSGEAVLPLSPG